MKNQGADERSRESFEVVYYCGKKFYVDKATGLYTPQSSGRPVGGRFGVETVNVRVPVILLPLIDQIKRQLRIIETCKRNIESSPQNTSPRFSFEKAVCSYVSREEVKSGK